MFYPVPTLTSFLYTFLSVVRGFTTHIVSCCTFLGLGLASSRLVLIHCLIFFSPWFVLFGLKKKIRRDRRHCTSPAGSDDGRLFFGSERRGGRRVGPRSDVFGRRRAGEGPRGHRHEAAGRCCPPARLHWPGAPPGCRLGTKDEGTHAVSYDALLIL
jgi:hypothetical protein